MIDKRNIKSKRINKKTSNKTSTRINKKISKKISKKNKGKRIIKSKGNRRNKTTKYLKQIGGEPSISIIESNSDFNNLAMVGQGVPNILYYDKKMNVIVKIKKTRQTDSSIPFVTITNSFEETTTNLSTDDEINEFVSNIKSRSDTCDITFDMIKNYIESSEIINNLPTFLKFKSILVYNNIGVTRLDYVESPLIVPSFEHLTNVSDDLNNFGPTLKDEMIAIIRDFKIFNSSGYTHRDLQNNCRNIVSYYNDDTSQQIKKLKVIDLDDPKNFINDTNLSNLLENLLGDYISLNKCLIKLKLLKRIIFDIPNLITFIKSLDLDIVVKDTSVALTTDYPTYKLNLAGWVKMSIYDANKGIYDSDKELYIVLNNKPVDQFENIEVKNYNKGLYYYSINLLENREKITTFIESIYDSLIANLSI